MIQLQAAVAAQLAANTVTPSLIPPLQPSSLSANASRKTGDCFPRLANIMFSDLFFSMTLQSEMLADRQQLDSGQTNGNSPYWQNIQRFFVDPSHKTGIRMYY